MRITVIIKNYFLLRLLGLKLTWSKGIEIADTELISEDTFKKDFVAFKKRLKEAQAAKKYINQQLAYGTKRVYRSDWYIFENWCLRRQYQPTDATPEIVSMFIASQFKDGLHPSTLNRRLAAIQFAYSCLEKESPTKNSIVRATLKGARRDIDAPPTKSKKAALSSIVKDMVLLCPTNSLRDVRDRAILLLSFAGAFRRSELVAINLEDISFNSKGMDIKIHRSKTDQEGKGDFKVILPSKDKMYCPITSVKKWIKEVKITDGALFRGITKSNIVLTNRLSVNVIYYLIKHCAFQLGHPMEDFSPHSLRAGFVTSAYENKAMLSKIMEQAHMKSMQTAQRYIRHAQRYENHAGENLL